MSTNHLFHRAWTRFHPRPDVRFDVEINAKNLGDIFDRCDDFELRQLWPAERPVSGVSVCWLDGVVDGQSVSGDVIRPLTDILRLSPVKSAKEWIELMERGAVWSYSVKRRESMDDLIGDIVQGSCAVVFDAERTAVTFETRTSNTRSISEPTVEKTVKGSKDAFVETLRINTSLVRRRVHDPALKLTQGTVGRKSATSVAVLYIDGVANPAIVEEVRKRIHDIDIDGLITAGNLEQYITDAPQSPFPQLMHTERPDKFAAELLTGRVGVLVDGLPLGFVAPAPLAQFMRVNEDNSQHFLIASLLTLLRWGSLLVAILLPSLLVAVSMYHQEMIPYRFMISMIDAKQKVPFSVAVEMLSMLIAFELLQEAGIRLPNPVGDTVSIIGALIVGQAAVEAQVVSPAAVIVVAASGICGFTQPSQDLTAALRVIRLFMVVMAIALGMLGIMLTLTLLVWHLCTIDTFGISYCEPLSEKGLLGSLKVFIRIPLWRDIFRPESLDTPDKRNQK